MDYSHSRRETHRRRGQKFPGTTLDQGRRISMARFTILSKSDVVIRQRCEEPRSYREDCSAPEGWRIELDHAAREMEVDCIFGRFHGDHGDHAHPGGGLCCCRPGEMIASYAE